MRNRNSASDKPLYIRTTTGLACGLLVCLASGCWVPLQSYGIPARDLPDEFRTPERTFSQKLNFANLTIAAPAEYKIGPNDVLDVTVPELFQGAEVRPIRVHVMGNGEVTLPLVGAVRVSEMNLAKAQKTINDAYADGFLVNPRVSLALAQKETISVVVLGEVKQPGVYALPKYENDVGHALAMAAGFTDVAADVIEIHRRVPAKGLSPKPPMPAPAPKNEQGQAQDSDENRPAAFEKAFQRFLAAANEDNPQDVTGDRSSEPQQRNLLLSDNFKFFDDPSEDLAVGEVQQSSHAETAQTESKIIIRIPLRGQPPTIVSQDDVVQRDHVLPEDVTLQPGDVVMVPRKPDETFYVTGRLSRTNVVNFSVRDRDRQLGNAFLLPNDRDIDVVTAVAMAGYIDPIESPSTVTVHRSVPGGPPMTIAVDLIKARYDWQENIYVQPGDILYLNPDPAWYFRTIFDRVVADLILLPYGSATSRAILGRR